MTATTQEIALDALQFEDDLKSYAKNTGLCSVIIKQGEVQRQAAKFIYMDGERFPKLQDFELEKEQYLRQVRKKLSDNLK